MKKPQIRLPHFRLPDLRIIVGVLAGILLVLGVILLVQGRMDTRNYQDQVIRIIQEQTGRQVSIRGKVTVRLLPRPTIYVPGVELRDPESATPTPAATVDLIRMSISPLTVFSDHPRITALMLEHPVLELVRTQDNLIHWDWVNAGLFKALAAESQSVPVSLDMVNGQIVYHDDRTDNTTQLEGLTLHAAAGKANGAFSIYGHNISFSLSSGGAAKSPALPFTLNAGSDDKSTLQLQGAADFSGELPVINGRLAVDMPDALIWVKGRNEATETLAPRGNNLLAQQKSAAVPLPLKITGDWAQQGLGVNLDNLHVQGLNSDGLGNLSLAWKDWRPDITCDIQFSTLDYTPWSRLFSAVMEERRAALASAYGAENAVQGNPLPKEMQLTLIVMADRLLIDSQPWEKAELSAVMDEGSVTINQFSLALPGAASLHLFGIISPENASGLRFEGSAETQGKSLRDMLAGFDESAASLPEAGFGPFYIRSNIFISPQQMRLSEADVHLSDLRLNGGLVTYFDQVPRMEADIRLKDIHFDYFRDVWREEHKKDGSQDFFLKFDKANSFGWLKKLATTIDLKIYVDNFTFLERPGTNASFRVYARPGQFGLYDVNFNYPGETVKAGLSLDVTGDEPALALSLSTSVLDTHYFSADPTASAASPSKNAAAQKPEWSQDLIDMSWMNGFSGTFDLAIGKLLHHRRDFDDVRFKAAFKNDLMTFQDVGFNYWRGRATILGSLYGGKVPGLSISYTLYDADLQNILKDTIGRENITGNVNLSGTLLTSGVNMLSWLSQAEATLGVTARGVTVQGLNLPGVVEAVQVSRTASDVFNSVNLALGNGATALAVDGTINLKEGVMRTPGLKLQSDQAPGVLSGEVQLLPWTMDLSAQFQFPQLSQETVPGMTLELAGPINAPALKTDTSSLEAYVAKRIISK